MKRRAKLQRLYHIFPLRTLDTTKKRGVTLLYTMFEGGFIFARNTAGESPASFGTDWTVKSARPSEVRKRRPYPVVGFPASSVKIVVGMSTAALVSGTAYLCQAIGSADAGIGESEAPAVASSGVASEEACTPAVTLPLLCGVVIELVISDAAFHCSVGRLSGPVGAAASRAVTSALEGCSADAIVSRADVSSRLSASARFSLSSSACLNSFCLASAICLVSSACAAFSRSRVAARLRAATSFSRADASSRASASGLAWLSSSTCLNSFCLASAICLVSSACAAFSRSRTATRLPAATSLSRADASSRASASDFAWLLSSACFKSLRLEFAIRLLSKACAAFSRSRTATRLRAATSLSRADASSRASASDLASLSSSACLNSFCLASAICLAFVERLLELLLLGIGNLLGLQCLCGILALAHGDEIAGRDLTFASGRKLTGERLRSCLAFIERLLELILLGIGNLLGLQYGLSALAHCSEIAERLRSCLAFVERLLELLLLGIGNLLGLQCLCGILALAHGDEIAGRDLILASGRKLTGERLRSCLAFIERLLQLLLLGIGNLLGLQCPCGIFALAHGDEIAGRDLTFASGRKLTGERLRFCLAFVERLLQVRPFGIRNSFALQGLGWRNIFALPSGSETADSDRRSLSFSRESSFQVGCRIIRA